MSRKLLIITSIVLIICILILAGYYFFAVKKVNPTIPGTSVTIKDFFPFGTGSTPINPNATSTGFVEIPENPGPTNFTQRLRMISNEPVAGSLFIENKEGSLIRYIEKATGHIYDVSTYSTYTNRVSNTTIADLYSTSFTQKGDGLVSAISPDGRVVQTVYKKTSSLTGSSTPNTSSVLGNNIAFVDVSPNGTSIVTEEGSGLNRIISTSNPDGNNKKNLWKTSIKMIPRFINNTTILLTTRPNYAVPGFAYTLDTNGVLKKIIGDIRDLSIIGSPNTVDYMYYTSANNSMYIYSTNTGSTTPITPKTFPDKCVWAPGGQYVYCGVPKEQLSQTALDDWYLGTKSYSDELWQYDIKNNRAGRLVDLESEGGRAIDVINMKINQKEDTLIFENKQDGSLWSFKI